MIQEVHLNEVMLQRVYGSEPPELEVHNEIRCSTAAKPIFYIYMNSCNLQNIQFRLNWLPVYALRDSSDTKRQ